MKKRTPLSTCIGSTLLAAIISVPYITDPVVNAQSAQSSTQLTQLTQSARTTLEENYSTFPPADEFPGKVPSDAPRITNKAIEVNFDYHDFSYLRMSSPPGTWVSTGLYAPPNGEISLNVPEGITDLDVQIGAHTDKLKNEPTQKRAPVVVLRQKLVPGINKISNPYGGLLYLIPTKAKPGKKAIITISGAVNAPYFILGKTTEQQWKNMIRNYPAPWAELQSKRVILTVPSEDIRKLDHPKELMEKWDEIINHYDELVGLAPNKPEPNRSPDRPFRYVADKEISAGWMHSGYPIMFYQGSTSKAIVDSNKIQHDGWGFWHELGHDYQQGAWEWNSIVEVTTNLHSLNIQTKYGNPSRLVSKDKDGKSTYDKALTFVNSNTPGKNFNDDKQIDVWERLVMFMQLQQAYGWDFYTKLHIAYRELPANQLPKNTQEKIDTFVVMTSKCSGENLLPFFDKWRLTYSDQAKKSVLKMNVKPLKKEIWKLKQE
ncbi:enhancin-like peptidase M60 family [Aneurinibacillus soli]|uniref:Viral enhancin protein n=1 Tax=Aneurinibacillus soli TaxID=1500254 RepID=A0A0U5BBX9_9BACL|nr:M60 family metallopeptidase [Aneurinibacillus soli]PYE62816.1 enhancin-like peptidase M60 family [Aneurinibacillus soli]BAU29126.1 Viral enhancin protein [Aneurinibacillus soli]